jgi:hypothetical protein
MSALRVLLVGKGLQTARTLVSRLEGKGCLYQSANTLSEASRLLHEQSFDLVLSAIFLENTHFHPLSEILKGTPTTLFYSYAVEDKCWWILGLKRGSPCLLDGPAFRPSEFPGVLDEVLGELISFYPARAGMSSGTGPAELLISPLGSVPTPDQQA